MLRLVNKEASDGYTIQKGTGFDNNKLFSTLGELQSQSLVRVEGDLNPTSVGKVYVWVPPSSKGYVNMMIYGLP